ncbi:CARDB domain-containing protein [Aquimarina gracilis]|uniref:CARDB domain-containing protein n=1 Tax=Aquimarina gracilis TaxID=874422 RepID=A0ABU6A228_9FLAO|nr:CARDB domain-containing protein [Aquimarina gracilis]MEB3348105.1 CARDB domain-containing protein [Aquimarina gracilis]
MQSIFYTFNSIISFNLVFKKSYILLFSFSLFSFTTFSKETSTNSNLQNTKAFDVYVDIYKRHIEIRIPDDVENVIRSYGYQVTEGFGLDIYVNYIEDIQTNDSILLDIYAPFINTTLDPVKIPPKDNSRNSKKNIDSKNNEQNTFFTWVYLNEICQWQTINGDPGYYICEEFYPTRGDQKITVSAKLEGNPGYILDEKEIRYKVYDANYDFDLFNRIDTIQKFSNNDIAVKGHVFNNFGRNRYNSRLHLYASDDKKLDDSDTYLDQVNIGPLDRWSGQPYMFSIKPEDFEELHGKYLLCKADANDELSEVFERNNVDYKKVASDLQITDVRMYRTSNNMVAISSTISNKGNIAANLSKLDYYVEMYPRRFVSRATIPSLQPNESYTSTTYITWQYFSLRLHGRDLILIADADNNIDEISEVNNEKRFSIPRQFGNEQTYVTIYPNPFSTQVTFEYPINYANTDIKLSIYDQRGVLKYQTNRFHRETGKQTIVIPAEQIGNIGVYHYSFLKGRNNTYYPFTGTIVRQ